MVDIAKEELEACFPEFIYVAKCSDVLNDSGDIEYGQPKRVRAYVEVNSSFVEDSDGTERFTDVLIITTECITDHDQIWLPGEDPTQDSESRCPKRVNRCIDFDTRRIHHYEVIV